MRVVIGAGILALLLITLVEHVAPQPLHEGGGASRDIVGTYSIIAWDSSTGDLGVAVQSKFLAVGAVVPFAKAGVGAIATQAFANTSYGPQGLSMLEHNMSAAEVVGLLTQSDSNSS